MSRRSEQFARELHDPALTALLRETYAEDPALVEAPGRTERIMRLVLASGTRPARPTMAWWAPLGWATGAAGVAAGVLAVVLSLAGTPGQFTIAGAPAPAKQSVTPAPSPQSDTIMPLPTAEVATPGPRVENPWIAQDTPARETVHTPAVVAAAPEVSPVTTAAALYDAGSVAQVAGEYEMAYQAFQASYDTMPTPDALLASGEMLQQLAQEALEPEG